MADLNEVRGRVGTEALALMDALTDELIEALAGLDEATRRLVDVLNGAGVERSVTVNIGIGQMVRVVYGE